MIGVFAPSDVRLATRWDPDPRVTGGGAAGAPRVAPQAPPT